LKKHWKVTNISARWVPHLLTKEQKRQRVKVAKKLLQMFPKYDKKQFAGDDTWVNYFEPVEKFATKSGPLNTTKAQ
jgi:histone-lysine N-methyltransferase SETMAR